MESSLENNMQTFLPYPDFNKCARVLDPSRLGNQFYREGLTLLRGGWPNHPASKMWQGYMWWLCEYLLACSNELKRRGRHYPKHDREVLEYHRWLSQIEHPKPSWLGDNRLHASHRSNLLRKYPEYYGRFGWSEPDDLPYFWPTKENDYVY